MPWLTVYVHREYEKPKNWDQMIQELINRTAIEFDCLPAGVEYREIPLEKTINAFSMTVQLEFSVRNIWKLLQLWGRLDRLEILYTDVIEANRESWIPSYGLTIRPLLFARFAEVSTGTYSR